MVLLVGGEPPRSGAAAAIVSVASVSASRIGITRWNALNVDGWTAVDIQQTLVACDDSHSVAKQRLNSARHQSQSSHSEPRRGVRVRLITRRLRTDIRLSDIRLGVCR